MKNPVKLLAISRLAWQIYIALFGIALIIIGLVIFHRWRAQKARIAKEALTLNVLTHGSVRQSLNNPLPSDFLYATDFSTQKAYKFHYDLVSPNNTLSASEVAKNWNGSAAGLERSARQAALIQAGLESTGLPS